MKLPQLSLRDLFWLVLVCALAVGWAVHARRISTELKQAQHELSLPYDERLALAKENEEEWREIHDRMLEAIEAEGYIASWAHHSRTVVLERRSP